MPRITTTVLFPSGMIECSAIVDGHLVRHRYGGYTKREAVRLFRAKLGSL